VIDARSALTTAESEERNVETQISDIKRKLETDYGKQLEFAKLDGECFSLDAGEYVVKMNNH
jgi:hypothetical protein